MHISPCGWYCFQLDSPYVTITDTQEKTEIKANDFSYVIELLCARKEEIVQPEDISQIHEDYLKNTRFKASKSVMAENSFGVHYYLTRSSEKTRPYTIVCHLFWSQYCLFLHFSGDNERYARALPETLFNLLQTIQPLTFDT